MSGPDGTVKVAEWTVPAGAPFTWPAMLVCPWVRVIGNADGSTTYEGYANAPGLPLFNPAPAEARAALIDLIADMVVLAEREAHEIIDAILANPALVMAALGFKPVAMADSDCGWTVHHTVEEAGAWSTAREAL